MLRNLLLFRPVDKFSGCFYRRLTLDFEKYIPSPPLGIERDLKRIPDQFLFYDMEL